MDPTFTEMFSGLDQELSTLHVSAIVPRLVAAVLIGAVLATRLPQAGWEAGSSTGAPSERVVLSPQQGLSKLQEPALP